MFNYIGLLINEKAFCEHCTTVTRLIASCAIASGSLRRISLCACSNEKTNSNEIFSSCLAMQFYQRLWERKWCREGNVCKQKPTSMMTTNNPPSYTHPHTLVVIHRSHNLFSVDIQWSNLKGENECVIRRWMKHFPCQWKLSCWIFQRRAFSNDLLLWKMLTKLQVKKMQKTLHDTKIL